MSHNQEEADQMVDYLLGNSTQPPNGSVFSVLHDSQQGPPMMRMMVLQAAFAIAGRLKVLDRRGKIVLIVIVSLSFMFWDLAKFLNMRQPNVYDQIGLDRSASIF
jgi:hypothetical protein